MLFPVSVWVLKHNTTRVAPVLCRLSNFASFLWHIVQYPPHSMERGIVVLSCSCSVLCISVHVLRFMFIYFGFQLHTAADGGTPACPMSLPSSSRWHLGAVRWTKKRQRVLKRIKWERDTGSCPEHGHTSPLFIALGGYHSKSSVYFFVLPPVYLWFSRGNVVTAWQEWDVWNVLRWINGARTTVPSTHIPGMWVCDVEVCWNQFGTDWTEQM